MPKTDCNCPARDGVPCPLSEMDCSYRSYASRRLSCSSSTETDDAMEMGVRAALRGVLDEPRVQ